MLRKSKEEPSTEPPTLHFSDLLKGTTNYELIPDELKQMLDEFSIESDSQEEADKQTHQLLNELKTICQSARVDEDTITRLIFVEPFQKTGSEATKKAKEWSMKFAGVICLLIIITAYANAFLEIPALADIIKYEILALIIPAFIYLIASLDDYPETPDVSLTDQLQHYTKNLQERLHAIQHICGKLGFSLSPEQVDNVLEYFASKNNSKKDTVETRAQRLQS